MSRIIKFRAWDNINKRMGYFDPGFQWNDEYDLWFISPVNWNNRLSDVPCEDNINLMQFTGLTDKAGKDIYEGDVIKWCFVNTGDLDEKEYTDVVEWSDCGFFLDGGAPLTVAMDDCEVVGNIYENPDLINPT